MEKIITIGLDVAKHVFQVHGIDSAGAIIIRRKLRREDVVGFFTALSPCLIGVEACATGHHWARILMALRHEVRLMPASYVKPYVKLWRGEHNLTSARGQRLTAESDFDSRLPFGGSLGRTDWFDG